MCCPARHRLPGTQSPRGMHQVWPPCFGAHDPASGSFFRTWAVSKASARKDWPQVATSRRAHHWSQFSNAGRCGQGRHLQTPGPAARGATHGLLTPSRPPSPSHLQQEGAILSRSSAEDTLQVKTHLSKFQSGVLGTRQLEGKSEGTFFSFN